MMNPEELISAWEDAYREYGADASDDFYDTSRAVAKAWGALAESVELPWWLYAAVRSAAEAFEFQGEPGPAGVPAMLARRAGIRFGGRNREAGDDPDPDDERAMDTSASAERTVSFSPVAAPPVITMTTDTDGMRWPRSDDRANVANRA